MRKDHMINVHAIFARGFDILTSKKFLSHMDAQAEASRSAPTEKPTNYNIPSMCYAARP